MLLNPRPMQEENRPIYFPVLPNLILARTKHSSERSALFSSAFPNASFDMRIVYLHPRQNSVYLHQCVNATYSMLSNAWSLV